MLRKQLSNDENAIPYSFSWGAISWGALISGRVFIGELPRGDASALGRRLRGGGVWKLSALIGGHALISSRLGWCAALPAGRVRGQALGTGQPGGLAGNSGRGQDNGDVNYESVKKEKILN